MIELTNKNGASVWLTEIGAGVVSVIVPDRDGNLADVALGYKDEKSYIGDGPCSGKIPGRYANRIAKGRFSLDGNEYRLPINNDSNHLHGGPNGFSNKKWEIVPNKNTADNGRRVQFTLTSPNNEEGYPGKLVVNAIYTWSEENILRLDIFAQTDAPTVINLTNHTYWNLKGENSGTILDHNIKINALKWLPTDSTLIPTGEIANVKGTPMDFTEGKIIGKEINNDFPALKYGKGYDNCWVLNEGEGVKEAAVLTEESTGRKLTIYTTQPAVQVYTGNWLSGSPISKSGRSYNDYEGVAIECQNFPDAPNHSNFPNAILRPSEKYHQIIEFRFNTNKPRSI